MFRPLPFFIGLRYTRAKGRNHFISFISLISMLGLTLGVRVMILVLSVISVVINAAQAITGSSSSEDSAKKGPAA